VSYEIFGLAASALMIALRINAARIDVLLMLFLSGGCRKLIVG